MGSITQFATPPQQQQAQQSYAPSQPQAAPAPAGGSYAARSAAAHAGSTTNSVVSSPTTATMPAPSPQPHQQAAASPAHHKEAHDAAQQTRILTDATRKVQEHSYYMKQAMDRDDLPQVLDRAMFMVGELGEHRNMMLNPKNYYELHMRALDDMPNLEEYFMGVEPVSFVYEATQYTPKVLPRLYLQICAASALIRSQDGMDTSILKEIVDEVKCVQNPVRGLFLRHYLLQAFRDKVPDTQEGIDFVMQNFIEMNKLWVRLQHLPGDGKSKEQRRKRERERNELRILVGTNLVRLSQMESAVTSQVYGQEILPKILEQIVACGDPLAQAYLMDCIIQVFPDEYHIETLSILLAVCPKLREKVNIRTILQSLMDRLANYYADEELLDEQDTNQVKQAMATDSFPMFEECVQNVYNARGPKLTSKEVIRLQTALLNFSLKCYPGNMEQLNKCLGVCVNALHQASNAIPVEGTVAPVPVAPKLDDASIAELQKLLSIPLESLALRVLELHHYSDLLACLPWEHRRDVGMAMLHSIVISGGSPPKTPQELEDFFNIVAPVFREEQAVPHQERTERASALLQGLGVSATQESFGPTREEGATMEGPELQEEVNLVSKLIHMLDHEDTDVAFEMLVVARNQLSMARVGSTLVPIVFSALRLADRIYQQENPPKEEEKAQKSIGEPMEAKQDSKEEIEEQAPDASEKDVAEETKSPNEPVVEEGGEAPETGNKNSDLQLTVDRDKAPSNGAVDEAVVAQSPVEKSVSCRKLFVFLQKTIAMLAKSNPELGVRLYLQTAATADALAALGKRDEFRPIMYELISQAFTLYEDEIGDSKAQSRNIKLLIGTLLACRAMSNEEYESLIPKAAQYSAKLLKKPDQCQMVALCAHLFYRTGENDGIMYQNPKRALECLQRALKLADASTTASASYVYLFVDLLDHYVYFFEKENPSITEKYVTGLAALIKEHLKTLTPMASGDAAAINDARAHFDEILRYIKRQKESSDAAVSARFSLIQCDPNFVN
jgi:vacuolar protein sorting-associated protein 35